MNPEIFQQLSTPYNAKQARSTIIGHITSQAALFEPLTSHSFTVAYNLAGLMATDYVRSLPSNDPVVEALSLAGELEIKPANAEALAKLLTEEIARLNY